MANDEPKTSADTDGAGTNEKRAISVKRTFPGRNGGTLQAGGPGKPKGAISLVEEMRRKLKDAPDAKAELIEASYQQALKGDPVHLKVWLDRIDGPVRQELDHTSGGDRVSFTFAVPTLESSE